METILKIRTTNKSARVSRVCNDTALPCSDWLERVQLNYWLRSCECSLFRGGNVLNNFS